MMDSQRQRGVVLGKLLTQLVVGVLLVAACGSDGDVLEEEHPAGGDIFSPALGLAPIAGTPVSVLAGAVSGDDHEGLGGPLIEDPPPDASGSAPTAGTPVPDFAGAVFGDDAAGALPLGAVNDVPGEDYLNFLFEFCQPGCFRDAHFMDPNNPQVGSGSWTAGHPFHIRHGFINNSDEPLGDGFDVVVYVTGMDDAPSEFGGVPAGATIRYTSDYVLRGTSDQCGPTYKTQTEPATCEWFVHDFPDGLPEGRHALWAVWEAPCWAWVDLGFTDTCDDPNEVISMFSSGVDSPFGPFPPSFTEVNEAQLTPEGSDSAPLTWQVRPGDHLWSIAAEHLAIVLERPPTRDEHRTYWVEVIEAARRIIRSGDPDLIYPGEVIPLPPLLDAGIRA